MIAGALEIQLRADIARLQADMNKVKSLVGGTASYIERAMGSAKLALGSLGAGIGLGALTAGFASSIQDIVKMRSALDDLADTTGDNVKTLDALRRQAFVSGFQLDQVGSAATKLARNLNNADDEGQAAAQAIKAIGLSVEEVRALKPADAMFEVARALDKFEDGAGKVAVAVALMGKEGAKMLPFLKDLVNDGDAVGKITAEQAAQAEKLEKEWRRLNLIFKDGKEALATLLIPELMNLVAMMQEAIRTSGLLGGALRMIEATGVVGTPAERIASSRKNIEQLNEGIRIMAGLKGYEAAIAKAQADIIAQEGRMDFAKFQQRLDALRLTGPQFLDARDLKAGQRAILDPGKLGGSAGAAARARAERDTSMQDYAKALEAEMRIQEEANALTVKFYQDQDKKNAVLEEAAERWRDMIDPMRKYQRELEAIAQNEKLSAEEKALVTEIIQQRQFEEANKHVRQETEKLDEAWKDLGLTFSSAFEDAIVNGKKFSDVLKGIEQDIARILARKFITEPLANGLSNAASGAGGIVGFFKNLFGSGSSAPVVTDTSFMNVLGGYAEGTNFVPQTGPYLLHQGEKVIPANENEWSSGDVYITNNIDARGADIGVEQRVQAQLDKFARTVPALVVDAKRRNVGGKYA